MLLKQSSGSLQTFGLRTTIETKDIQRITLPDGPPESHWLELPPPPGYKSIDEGKLGIGYSSGVCQLDNISRIRVSCGSVSGPRQPHTISGLCFEFTDMDEPVYLGQWLNEVANFDIGQESGRVVALTTWRLFGRDRTAVAAGGNPWVDPFSHRRRTDVQYTGLKIETGSGKIFEIPPEDPEQLGYEKVQFRENAFEEFVSHNFKQLRYLKQTG